MIGVPSRLSEKVSKLSLAARCAVLNGCLLVALVVALAVAYAAGRPAAPFAVLLAALVCTLSANAALLVSVIGQGIAGGIGGIFGGMLIGMIPPLAVGLALHRRGGPLAEAGVLLWILAFYLTALVVKTCLIVPLGNKDKGSNETRRPTTPRISSSGAGA